MKRPLHLATSLILIASALGGSLSHAQTIPVPSHVVFIIEENFAYSQIIGNSAAPYINSLAANPYSAVFTQAYAIEHPSQPNYLDLFSGENQGETTDNYPTTDGLTLPFTTCNLAYQLLSTGKTFCSYCQSLPNVGSDVNTYVDGAGQNYYRKHNPVANWTQNLGSGANTVPDTVNKPFYGYFPDSNNYASLPTVAYVVPNGTDDMHDGSAPTSIDSGDTWFKRNLGSLIRWAYANNTLVIFTFDEDDDYHGNNIPTIFYGAMVQGGIYNQSFNLFNMLRTVEDMYGLGTCGHATDSSAISFCWKAGYTTGVATTTASKEVTVSPNPAGNSITFTSGNALQATITVTDLRGNLVGNYNINGNNLVVNTTDFASGLYAYKVINSDGSPVYNGKFVITHK